MGERTVSMYSPRAALFGGMLKTTTTSHASCCKQESSSQVSVQLFHTCSIAASDARARRGKCTGKCDIDVSSFAPPLAALFLHPTSIR
jgi:hypothetical protein